MGYSVPLTFVKVSDGRSVDKRQSDVAICATRIVALMSTDVYQARKTLTAEKKAGTLINACGTVKAKTAIFMDNGAVVSSPLTVNRIMSRLERANQPPQPSKTKKMDIYSVYDEEVEEEGEEASFEEDYDEDE